MISKYKNNLYIRLYNALDTILTTVYAPGKKLKSDFIEWEEIDPILMNILQNNGCKCDENTLAATIKILKDSYYLIFLRRAEANAGNIFFDYVDFLGVQYLVIFLDYFSGIVSEQDIPSDDDMSMEAVRIREMGNSVYYDAIKKIVEMFQITVSPSHSIDSLKLSAAAVNDAYAGAIIAINILNEYKPIDDTDISDMDIDDAISLLNDNQPMSLSLVGIRNPV